MDSTNHPPMYIEAESPEELRLMMLVNNRRYARRFHYFNIQFAQGKWYAWFELSESLKQQREGSDADKQES